MSGGVINITGFAPGQIWTADEELKGLENRATARVLVKNTGDRPVQVGSHFHFFEVNKALDFPRDEGWGRRLAIPAGTAVRFEPGLEVEVDLVDLGGERRVWGFNSLVGGRLDEKGVRADALEKARVRGFKGAGE